MSAQKDIWDKLEIIGKVLFVPILVGMIGLIVGNFQQEAAQQDKEFELALSVASTPEFISTDPLIASARDWANETLRERLGEDIPQSVLAATQGDVIAAITPQTAFVAIQSGEITQEQIAKTNGEWEVGAVTDIQFPVQDWAPVIRALQDTDAAAIMIDHWVAAELAAFAQQYAFDPVPGSLVYLQYGP